MQSLSIQGARILPGRGGLQRRSTQQPAAAPLLGKSGPVPAGAARHDADAPTNAAEAASGASRRQQAEQRRQGAEARFLARRRQRAAPKGSVQRHHSLRRQGDAGGVGGGGQGARRGRNSQGSTHKQDSAKKKSADPMPESLARKFPGKTAGNIQNMMMQRSRMDPGDELDLPELTDSERKWLWQH